ncbi:MAG: hypothetical protein ACLR6S_15140 [Lacrimispora saccharolytica]
MKWLSIKNIVTLLLIACAVLSFYFGKTMTVVQAAGIVAVLFFVILVIAVVPNRTSEQELFEGQDKREQYLALKRTAKNLEVVKYTLFLTMVCCVIGFGLTNEYAFIFTLIGAAVPYGVLRIFCIINLLRKGQNND